MSTSAEKVLNALGLTLAIAGRNLTMQPAVSKKGNIFYTIHLAKQNPGAACMYGVRVAPSFFDGFPATAQVADDTIHLLPGVTGSGNPKVSGSTQIDVDGETYSVRVQVSETKNGWNIIAKAMMSGGFGGGELAEDEDAFA